MAIQPKPHVQQGRGCHWIWEGTKTSRSWKRETPQPTRLHQHHRKPRRRGGSREPDRYGYGYGNSVYGDHPHQNDGRHLDGGVADGIVTGLPSLSWPSLDIEQWRQPLCWPSCQRLLGLHSMLPALCHTPQVTQEGGLPSNFLCEISLLPLGQAICKANGRQTDIMQPWFANSLAMAGPSKRLAVAVIILSQQVAFLVALLHVQSKLTYNFWSQRAPGIPNQ